MRLTDDCIRYAFDQAYLQATKSPDPSTQVGACLLTPYHHGEGYASVVAHNSPVPHLRSPLTPPSDHEEIPEWTPERRRLLTTHAEEAAILVAGKFGRMTEGSVMCAPWACCEKCATIIIRAGVSTLYVHDEAMARAHSRWSDEIRRAHTLLRDNGVEVNIWTAPPDFKRPHLLFQGVLS